jgi:hypothetical protein
MAALGFAEAFAKYGAKLKNVNWSVCALAKDGSLAVSVWQHHIRREGEVLVCRDTMERWSGTGKNELRERLAAAKESDQEISLVIATTPHPEKVDAGGDASKIAKTFAVREDLVGKVIELDGDKFAIQITKRGS